MADAKKKDSGEKAEERKDDERDEEHDEDERDEDDEKDGAEKDEDEKDEESDDESDESDDDEKAEGDGDEDEGEPDERAARVADALGVGKKAESEDDDEGEEAKPVDAEPVQNRATRRRELAIERRKKRLAERTAETIAASLREDDDEDEAPKKKALAPLPKDKNLRAKELLKRRREAAEKGGAPVEAQQQGLAAGEVVDDVLARGTDRVIRWIKRNNRSLLYAAIAAVIGTVGFLVYRNNEDKKLGEAGDVLAKGARTERGRIMENDQRPAEQKELDPVPVFKTFEDRQAAAASAYHDVAARYPGQGAGILGRLGEAGALLDVGKYAEALAAYEEVGRSKLAAADPDVKGRALEGAGYAKESKGDLDGAIAVFQQLKTVEGKHWKDLAEYHEGRCLLAKGETEKAKALLVAVHDRAKIPNKDGTGASQYLRGAVARLLKKIDPTLVPEERSVLGGGAGITDPEQLKKLQQLGLERQLRKLQEKKEKGGDHDHGHDEPHEEP